MSSQLEFSAVSSGDSPASDEPELVYGEAYGEVPPEGSIQDIKGFPMEYAYDG